MSEDMAVRLRVEDFTKLVCDKENLVMILEDLLSDGNILVQLGPDKYTEIKRLLDEAKSPPE